jgi:hypothetical protein
LSETVPLSCTLAELKACVQLHLGFAADDGDRPDLECICKLARKFDDNAVLNERGAGDYEAAPTAIIVHGSHSIAAVHILTYLLTSFPPAVRAAYILMRGETPRYPERAALSQHLYKALKAVVPLCIGGSNPLRLFESPRLLFGLILEEAKNLKVTKINDDSNLPYLGMSVYDLRNMITMDPVLSVDEREQYCKGVHV